jgi:hypothetical protein
MAEANQDARLKRSAAAGRDDRASEDVRRQDNDGTAFTVSERRKFRNEWTQEALPTPPEVPGFHLCWLSSTNSYDPIQKRIRMGYSPVLPSEVPGFEYLAAKEGEFQGMVACNEMLLFKIPNDLYQDMMAELHHYAPLEEEGRIKDSMVTGQKDSNGRPLGHVEGDGFNDLGAQMRTPNFL